MLQKLDPLSPADLQELSISLLKSSDNMVEILKKLQKKKRIKEEDEVEVFLFLQNVEKFSKSSFPLDTKTREGIKKGIENALLSVDIMSSKNCVKKIDGTITLVLKHLKDLDGMNQGNATKLPDDKKLYKKLIGLIEKEIEKTEKIIDELKQHADGLTANHFSPKKVLDLTKDQREKIEVIENARETIGKLKDILKIMDPEATANRRGAIITPDHISGLIRKWKDDITQEQSKLNTYFFMRKLFLIDIQSCQ